MAMGNNPVSQVDPSGGQSWDVWYRKKHEVPFPDAEPEISTPEDHGRRFRTHPSKAEIESYRMEVGMEMIEGQLGDAFDYNYERKDYQLDPYCDPSNMNVYCTTATDNNGNNTTPGIQTLITIGDLFGSGVENCFGPITNDPTHPNAIYNCDGSPPSDNLYPSSIPYIQKPEEDGSAYFDYRGKFNRPSEPISNPNAIIIKTIGETSVSNGLIKTTLSATTSTTSGYGPIKSKTKDKKGPFSVYSCKIGNNKLSVSTDGEIAFSFTGGSVAVTTSGIKYSESQFFSPLGVTITGSITYGINGNTLLQMTNVVVGTGLIIGFPYAAPELIPVFIK